jgi:hypothetical protein
VHDGKIGIVTPGGLALASNGTVKSNSLNFVCITFNNGVATIYLNSPYADISGKVTLHTGSNTLYLGQAGDASYWYKGTIDYFAMIPIAFSQVDVAKYYNIFIQQSNKTLSEDCLPSNSISLGFARTGSSAVIEYNDTDYKYMRNEGATKAEGNKRVFLGYKYFNGATALSWNNPFGTRKVRAYYTWAQDANGTNESPTQSYESSNYGLESRSASTNVIATQVYSAGAAVFNGTWQASGYIGAYCELL